MNPKNSTLSLVFLSIFVSAAAKKFIHFFDPFCSLLAAGDCNDIYYCQDHRDKGDLFTTSDRIVGKRDLSSSSTFITKPLNVNEKRSLWVKPTQCGALSGFNQREFSNQFTNLVPLVEYDLITDYPYDGATGGKIQIFSFLLSISLVKPDLTVSFSHYRNDRRFCLCFWSPGNLHIVRINEARTDIGGVRFTFKAFPWASWYQVIFLGDKPATAAIKFYIVAH